MSGPFDFTLAGTPVSMVSLDEPDLERYPRFADALAAAEAAELEPGDALYIPYLWWHGVKSLEPFNVLVNYWWNDAQSGGVAPSCAHDGLARFAGRCRMLSVPHGVHFSITTFFAFTAIRCRIFRPNITARWAI